MYNGRIPSRQRHTLSCSGLSFSELCLPFPLHLPCLLDTKAVLKDLPDIFQRQTRALGIEENDEEPAEEADARIKAKCTARCHSFHHGQER